MDRWIFASLTWPRWRPAARAALAQPAGHCANGSHATHTHATSHAPLFGGYPLRHVRATGRAIRAAVVGLGLLSAWVSAAPWSMAARVATPGVTESPYAQVVVSPRTLLSASMWLAASSVPGAGASLCLFADASVLLRPQPATACSPGAMQWGSAAPAVASPACRANAAAPKSALRALHLIPTFMVASPYQRKRLMVLAHFNHGLVCDVTTQVTWEASPLSVWQAQAPSAFFALQAKLANRVSNGALIQGIQGTLAR